jgi:exonuclease SbcC
VKIHRLEISAFGPFAGTERIDFDRLSAHGLFLLNGATGAGKTSVLDAICFALYGSVPGARQDGKRLRSDHAAPAAEPRVTCEFSARGRRFEVSRSPAWDKPSARGKNGFTGQQANTLLRERVDGAWLEKSGRNDEAGAEIAAVLGMDREQFTRVVMLPQGDFAAFLRSKASDRLDLLQKLFGTERFEAVEQELGRRSLAARTEVASLNDQLTLLLHRAETEAAPLELDASGAPAPDAAEAFLEWLQEAAAAKAGLLLSEAEEAEALRAGRARLLDAETARAGRQAKLAAAEGRRSEAGAAAPALKQNAERLGRHRKAEVLGGQLHAVESAEAAEVSAATAMEKAFAELRAAAETDPELAGMNPGDGVLPAVIARLRSLHAVLEERLPDESALTGLVSRAVGLQRTVDDLVTGSRSAAAVLTALHSESAAVMAGIRPLEPLAAEVQLRAKEAAAAEELVSVVRRHGSAVAACVDVAERHRVARDRYQDLRQGWLDLREVRLANAAAELAAQLAPGDPCPVCGSADHPVPAPAALSALSVVDAEKTAQADCEAAEKNLAAIEGELSAAQQTVAVLAAQGGDTAPEVALQAAVEANERAADARRAAAQLATSRARKEQLEDEISAAERAQATAASGIAKTESTILEVQEQAASLDAALGSLRAEHSSLGSRVAAITATMAVLECAEGAQALLQRSRSRTAEVRLQLEVALPAAGFDSADAARQVLLTAAEASGLEVAIRAGQDETARIDELFAGDDLALAVREVESRGPVVADELEALRVDAEAAEKAAREVALASGLAAKSVRTLNAISEEYTGLAAAGRGPRERAELLTSVAEAARGAGDNSYRMSLNSYVLAARLEQVAVAASERLVGMSDGRYMLQHSDAKAARGAKSGLGLEVVDQWTGHRRDTATLSGGESFMASLALALGLADVVQQESGGVDIETLFVDEGFGSLDEQALEQVMDALESLRDGGRVVGLVSHVAEMKQRISTQLQVVKGRNGSTLHISDDVPVG